MQPVFPPEFIANIQALLPPSQAQQLLQALEAPAPVSIRLNPAKPTTLPYPLERPVAWCPGGHYLPMRPVFTLDPLLHAGTYYVQEASSMFLAHIMQHLSRHHSQPMVALDLCAAPGGKSTLLAGSLPPNSLLVANEIIRSRVHILAENIAKWGQPHVVVTNNDPSAFGQLPGMFDLVAVDAPCSGEGMFRKDPQARQEWSPANVQLCAQRQQRILRSVWPTVKEGGYLIYSTCTFNTLENEDNVHWLCQELGAQSIPIPLDNTWGITPSQALAGTPAEVHGYRFFPHQTMGEGFFVALLRKTAPTTTPKPPKPKRTPIAKPTPPPAALHQWLLPTAQLAIAPDIAPHSYTAWPIHHSTLIQALQQHLNVYQAGVPLATHKGTDLIPTIPLALSTALNPAAFDSLAVDLDTALHYLRRNTIAGTPGMLGYQLLRYQEQPLGFIKNIGSRSNNLYPQEWRIRHL